MPGGLIQLTAHSGENVFLIGNPQITFFKTVYKRHTNFSMENIEITLPGIDIEIKNNTETKYRVKIERNGDLFNQIFFKIEIPSIIYNSGTKFKWVKSLGEAIIKSCSLFIGGELIEKLTSEQVNIYNRLKLNKNEREIYDNLILNTDEFYDPEVFNTRVHGYTYNGKGSLGNYRPSIEGKTLSIPLPLWFSKDNGLAVPLIALQYHDVELEIVLRPLKELFTIVDNNNIVQPTQNLDKYIFKKNIDYNLDNSPESKNIGGNNFVYNPRLDINYIFLDNKERNAFSKMKHEYLIQINNNYEVNVDVMTNNVPVINFIKEINLYHPIKDFIWVFRRTDNNIRNEHFNYSNWVSENDSYWGSNNPYLTSKVKNDISSNLGKDNWEHYNKKIMKSCEILFNKNVRLRRKTNEYFNYLQPYMHYNNGEDCIYTYSFSLEPDKYQPTGFVNASGLDSIIFNFELNKKPSKNINTHFGYGYDFILNYTTYNILSIQSGMCSLLFKI